MAADVNCRRAQVLISKQLDGECAAAGAAQLRRHLEDCAACRRLAAEFRDLAGLLDQAPRVPPATGFVPRVMAALPRDIVLRPSRAIRLAQLALGVAAFVGGLSLSTAFENGVETSTAQAASREIASRPANMEEMLRPEALDGDLILAMTGPEEQAWPR